MKKIWLRKEREDSKSQQESKSGSSDCTFKKSEVTVSRPPDDVEKSKDDSDGIAEQNSRTESEIRENEDSRSSKTSQKFLSALPESTPYQGSFYHPMDAPRIHPAYILAIQGAMDPYQLQRQIHFAVPSPFPFVPVAQMKKYSNGSHYNLPRAGNYDSYLVQSSREDRRFSGQSAIGERGREPSESGDSSSQNRSKFDYSHFSYSSKASFQRQSDEHCDRYRLGSDSMNLRPNFPRPEPFVSQVRKRAPNSPLEVPMTPTTLPGHDSVSVFPGAFVVPRNMMRLSVREEETDSGSRRTAETTIGILPTVIANMTELEVNDDDKLTKSSNYNNNNNSNGNNNYNSTNNNIKEASTSSSSTHQFANNVPNFRPYESIVTSSLSSSSSSSSLLNGSSMHPVGKTEHRVTFKMDERREANDKRTEEHRDRMDNNNNINNNVNNNSIINNNIINNNIINNNINNIINNNNRETRSTSSTTSSHPKDRVLGNAVAMPTGDDSVSNGDAMKDPNNPVVTTTVMASRGKGRPAKPVGKPGVDLPAAGGGLRSVIKCPTCMKVFNNSSALAKHKLTHSDERKYSCHLCSKAFKRQDHLNGHMMTHSSKKPFECKFLGCTKSYCDARSLRRHLENHHHDSINSCNGTGFMPGRMEEGRPAAQSLVQPDSCTPLPQLSDDAWNSKVVWAPGFNPLDEPKPVRCHVCGRRFKNVPALNGHMRLHGGYVNRDTEDEIDKQNDSVTTSLEIAKRKSWEANTKAFEEKPNYHHASKVIGQERASSLELLSSSSSRGGGGCSTTPWDLSKDESDGVEFESCSLPREELEYKERGLLRGESDSERSEKLRDRKARLIGRDASSKTREFPIENARPTSSAVIDLTNEEALHAKQRGEFVNVLKKEAAFKLNEKMSRGVESFHYSKYSNSFQTVASVQSSKGHFEETTMDLSNKTTRSEGGSEISPKRLEASSLYLRRLRRFSERSPNSDESSRHSGGTPSPLNLEKFAEEERRENDFVELVLRGSNDLLLQKVVSRGEKNEFFVPPNSQREGIEEMSNFHPSKIPHEAVVNSVTGGDLKQCEAKMSSSSYPGFYQNSAEPNRPHPANNTSGDSYCKTVCGSISVQHGTSVENPNVSLQHQSHSSLPCTPYTAHTPYTPRTTEPSSPRQAGFFQFPPNQQHEGSRIPSMEAPSIAAFDHDNPMETARIPEVQSGNLPQDCGSSTSEKSVKKQGGERKPSACRTRNSSDEAKVCDRSRASLYEEVSSSQESASSSSEDASHLNYLKARGKIVERSVTQSKSETSVLQEKQKEKLSARRKAKPAPLVLPPQKEMKERYATCRGREADDSSSDRRPRAPSPVLSGIEQSRTALRSALSSVDSGCPKSSARFSVDETPSGFLPQSGDSLVFNHLKEHCATGNARDFQSGPKTRQQIEISGDRTKDSLSEVSINVGPEYQATVPQLEGRLQVNQGMHPILLHLDKGPPR